MVTKIDSLLTVRRAMHIAATPERIWEEFTTFERMRAWFGIPTGHAVLSYEPGAGGHIECEVTVEGRVLRFGGRITVFEPPRELSFEDDWIPPLDGVPQQVVITFRLTPVAGGTIVEIIQHGFERLGERGVEVHRGHEGGWTTRQLEALRAIVEGVPA